MPSEQNQQCGLTCEKTLHSCFSASLICAPPPTRRFLDGLPPLAAAASAASAAASVAAPSPAPAPVPPAATSPESCSFDRAARNAASSCDHFLRSASFATRATYSSLLPLGYGYDQVQKLLLHHASYTPTQRLHTHVMHSI